MKRLNEALLVVVIVFVIAILIALGVKSAYLDRYEITGTVEKKWIDYSEEGSHYLVRIIQEDGSKRMLEVNRNVFHWGDYNPDLIYPDLEVNCTYNFVCWGWQFQFWDLYLYPNVIIAVEQGE